MAEYEKEEEILKCVYCNPLIYPALLAKKLGHGKARIYPRLRRMIAKKQIGVIDYGNLRALVAIKAIPGKRNRTPRVLI